MDETAAVETVSDALPGMATSTKVIIAGVAVAAVAAGATFVVRKLRAKKAQNLAEAHEETVLTPDEFIPAEKK